MIDFSLSKEQEKIKEEHRAFAEQYITPNAAKYDELKEFPWDIHNAIYDHGLEFGQVPKKFGGHGYSVLDQAIATEEFGAGCCGIGISLDATVLGMTPWIIGASDDQMKKFVGELKEAKGAAAYCLTEPGAGSDVAAIKTTAIKKGDSYIINGHKRFITNAEVSMYMTVFAIADPERGARSLTAFIVKTDSPGIEIKPRMKKMGQNASVQNEIIFTDVEVPVANRIGNEGMGFIYAMKTFDRTRTGVAALALGGARTAYEVSKEWAKTRIQFGKPIAANQAIGFMLADMATKVELARLMTWKAAWYYEEGLKSPGTYSAMAKMYASDIAMQVATDAVQIMGGEGYSTDFPVEKIMRDVKLTQICEGTNQIQRLVISKGILK